MAEQCDEQGCEAPATHHDADHCWCGDHLIAYSESLADEVLCLIEGCASPVREPDTTVLCLEHYISGGGPLHDAYTDWVRGRAAMAIPVSRTAFEAGWDARGTLKVEG